MGSDNETADEALPVIRERAPTPGVVLLWSAQAPQCRVFAFRRRPLLVGREAGCDIALLGDDSASRRHAELSCQHGELVVRDDASRNGTFVNGERVQGERRCALEGTVVRVGQSIFLGCKDIGAFDGLATLRDDDAIAGLAVRAAWAEAADAATRGRALLIHGETGTGKEYVARAFHGRGPRARGPFVAVNCARFEPDRAEADLFGSKRGAFTGAERDRLGAFQRANGGVLFLDEVAELEPEVQAKLLRALAEGVIEPMGGDPIAVSVGICCASHQDLRERVARGAFREDLFMRIAQREVELPPLRARREEIPWFVERFRETVAGAPPAAGNFVEACMLASWPGNLRALEMGVERSAAAAAKAGALVIDADRLRASGVLTPRAPSAPPPASDAPRIIRPRDQRDQSVLAELAKNHGDVALTAAKLKMGPSTVYDVIKRHNGNSKK